MLTQFARAPVSATAPARSNAALLEHRLSKFHAEVQPRVRPLAAEHLWIADLALSFPALLFALARPRHAATADAALRLVKSGAPLATVAQSAGVPLWMRAFPPEAFDTLIPALPDSPSFRRRIVNHLPSNWREAPKWMEIVGEAFDTADEDIALWFAREAPLKEKRAKSYKRRNVNQHRRLVALWAWCSMHVDPAQSFIATPWRSEMQWKAARDAASQWLSALYLPLYLGDRPIADTWLNDGEVDGYEFIALRTRNDVLQEAQAMSHCVAGYGQDLADNYTRLWSVRRNGERVATLALDAGASSLPQIRELSGPSNAQVSLAMLIAARRWLHSQDALDVDVKRFHAILAEPDGDAWRRLWRHYWLAKRRIPAWLPLKPATHVLYQL